MTRATFHLLGSAPEDCKRLVVDMALPPAKVCEILLTDVRRWRLARADGGIVLVHPGHVAWATLEALEPGAP